MFIVDVDSKRRTPQTIGVDFGVKQVKVPETDCVVELFLFDCPGQGVFNKLEQVSDGIDYAVERARHGATFSDFVGCSPSRPFLCTARYIVRVLFAHFKHEPFSRASRRVGRPENSELPNARNERPAAQRDVAKCT